LPSAISSIIFREKASEIIGVAGRHDPLVSHDLDILPFGARINHVHLDRLVRGRPPPFEEVRLDE
jgi:hypothetical protein